MCWERNPPAEALRDSIHLLGLLGCLLPCEPVVELHEQALGKGLPSPIDPAIVEDFGVLPANADGGGCLTMEVGAPALPALQRHPAKGRAAWRTDNSEKLRNIWLCHPTLHKPRVLLTMHASEVSISKYSCNPQFLGVHISTHEDIARWSLHHGFQLTAYPVRLQEEWGQAHLEAQGNCSWIPRLRAYKALALSQGKTRERHTALTQTLQRWPVGGRVEIRKP